jgi:hypothetical protein
MQMQNLEKCIPSIKLVYAVFEKAGYDKDKIYQLMKEDNILASLQKGQTGITYWSVGQALANQDAGRGSWTNEDPSWQNIARDLDNKAGHAMGIAAHRMLASVPTAGLTRDVSLSYKPLSILTHPLQKEDGIVLESAPAAGPTRDVSLSYKPILTLTPPLQKEDGHIVLKLETTGVAPILSGQLHVKLDEFESNSAARVTIQ